MDATPAIARFRGAAVAQHLEDVARLLDVDLPADGIVVQTQDEQIWAIADPDFAALGASR